MRKLLLLLLLLLCATVTHATVYYVAANGSDSQDCTEKTHTTGTTGPCLHAPGMPNYTGSIYPSQYAVHTGDQWIFRGGDIWHFGNSGASPYTGGTWFPTWDGVYWGVDPTYYTGGAWSRPIFTADNSPCNSGTTGVMPDGATCTSNPTACSPAGTNCTGLYYVSACVYQVLPNSSFPSNNQILFINNQASGGGATVDNIEFTGLCENDSGGQQSYNNNYVDDGGVQATPNLLEHLYIHGASHLAFTCVGNPSGHCMNLLAFNMGNADNSEQLQDIVDNSDGDPTGILSQFGGGYNVSQSVFRYAVGMANATAGHLLHDTLFEHMAQPGDDVGHGNMWQENTSDQTQLAHAYYDNVFRHVCTDSGFCPAGIEGFEPDAICYGVNTPTGCPGATTDYIFANVYYDTDPAVVEYVNIGYTQPTQGNYVLFNNTFQANTSGTALIRCSTNTMQLTLANNQYIGTVAPYDTVACPAHYTAGTPLTELALSTADATTYGYTPGSTYPYFPASANCNGNPSSADCTVGNGTNKNTAFCGALTTAAMSDPTLSDAATACLQDARYACVYNATPHTISCPTRTPNARPTSTVWDIGGGEFTGTGPAATPSASPGSGTYSGTQSVTLSVTGGAPVICYSTSTTPATNGTTGCTTGTLYTGAISISVNSTLQAIAGGSGYVDGSVGTFSYVITGFPGSAFGLSRGAVVLRGGAIQH